MFLKEKNYFFFVRQVPQGLFEIVVYYNLCSLCISCPQSSTKTTQSRGNHPWSQVLHWVWRKGRQPVHTGCQIGGQNRNGVQGMVLQSSLQPFNAVLYEFVLLLISLDCSINICMYVEKALSFLTQTLVHPCLTQSKYSAISCHSPVTSNPKTF